MEIGQQLNSPVQCRLCGNYGDHRFEIFDSKDISSSLSEKILRCLDIEVISSDPTTVICAECFNKLFGYDQFREVCHATNRKIKNSLSRHHNGDSNGFVSKLEVDHEAQVEPIATYLVSDSESNGEADELATSDNLTPKIERSEVDSDAQVNQSTESSTDEIPGFASTSSTFVKHECLGMISPKLEMIENEPINDVLMDASESEPTTDADCGEDGRGIISDDGERIGDSSFVADESDFKTGTDTDADGKSHDVRVPPKKIVRVTLPSMPTVTIKKEHVVKKKTKKNASKFPINCSSFGRCADSFENREAMKLHMETHHENRAERTFSCHLCEKTISNKHHLEQHMNSLHTQMVRFQCPERDCSRICTTRSDLKRHINAMHKNQVASECPKCSKAFAREHLLKKHLAITHGDGIAFVCDLCEKSFTRKAVLQRHIKLSHTNLILYECPEATCSKSFKQKFLMKNHFNAVHSQKKAHNCTKCPAKFVRKDNLRVHFLREH